MRVYHRLIHIRDQKERREDIPEWITSHPVFQFTTQFRQVVQAKSAPITKTSRLVVDGEGMEIFAKLAAVLREQGNTVMIYLVACILERLFGKDTIEDIEVIRGDLTIPEIIDGISRASAIASRPVQSTPQVVPGPSKAIPTKAEQVVAPAAPPPISAFGSSAAPFGRATTSSAQPAKSAFANLTSKPNPFGGSYVFGSTSAIGATPSQAPTAPLVNGNSTKSAFASFANGATAFAGTSSSSMYNVFGGSSFPSSSSGSFPSQMTIPSTSQTPPKIPTTHSTGSAFGTAFSHTTSLNPIAPAFTPPKQASTSIVDASPPHSSPPARPEPSLLGASSQPPIAAPLFPPEAPTLAATPTSSQPTVAAPTPPASGLFSTPTKLPLQPQQAAASSPAQPLVTRRQSLLASASSQPQPQPQFQTPPNLTSSASAFNLARPGRSNPRPSLSPLVPPPLVKIQPLSLPPTPTSHWFDPTSGKAPVQPNVTRKKSILGFPQLFMPPPESGELLSPLQLNSPAFPKTSAAPTASPSPLARDTPSRPLVESPTRIAPAEVPPLTGNTTPSAKAKGKARAGPVDLDQLLAEYLHGKHLHVMKHYYKRWEDKTIERGQWMEACERGEAYKAKVRKQTQRIPPTYSTPAMQSLKQEEEPKRRRMSAGEVIRPRRMRHSAAHYEYPTTDEDIAKRLREVHRSLICEQTSAHRFSSP